VVPPPQVWHPDVQFFHVTDEATGEHIASFFLDPYSRPENKRVSTQGPCKPASSPGMRWKLLG
jgi:Zn-dependent oligopeptidase